MVPPRCRGADHVQDTATHTMRIQLVGADEASVDGAPHRTAHDRWREYIDSYVLEYPTEWVGGGRGMPVQAPPFLRRCVAFSRKRARGADGVRPNRTLAGDEPGSAHAEGDLGIRVSLGSYKLFYEGGSWECVWHVRARDEDAQLAERAAARVEERRRAMARWA
jgi:paired amphipathic helix protein Sin3a